MNYSEIYKGETYSSKPVYDTYSGIVGWQCPSNIALIKYWGKKGNQLPINPSLSFTLSTSVTKSIIRYEYDKSIKVPQIEYYFEKYREPDFEHRVIKYLKAIEAYLPFLSNTNLIIESVNSFPHSAGIASSASSYGALALCLVSIEEVLAGSNSLKDEHRRKSSFLARLGSGSASRSVYGNAVLWGQTDIMEHSSDEVALPVDSIIHQIYKSYRDAILIIDDSPKQISSSTGHQLMLEDPFVQSRIDQAHSNLKRLIGILKTADLKIFNEIVENEALSLHAMMLTSNPGYFLLKQSTIELIQRIRQFRNDTNIPVCFTLDAGPNVHLLFPDEYSDKVLTFITDDLDQFCINNQFYIDKVGDGPLKLEL